jgi:hypothetical protein
LISIAAYSEIKALNDYPAYTALPAAMRYILKAGSYDRRGAMRKTILHNSRKRCNYGTNNRTVESIL